MFLFKHKELEQLELVKKENQMLLDKVSELSIGVKKLENGNQQLLDKVADLEKEKQKLINESVNSYMQLYNVENEKRQLIESNCELEKIKQALLDKVEKLDIQLHEVKNENKQLSETVSRLEEEKIERDNDLSNNNLGVSTINQELLKRAELAEKFETADRFHKFLESFGKVPKLVDLIFQLEKNDEDVEEMVLAFNKNESKLIEDKSAYLFEYMSKNEEIQPRIQVIEEISKKIDSELEQTVISELDKAEKEKEKHLQWEREERFGKVLYTDEDIINYGNTPGNITTGGGCCIYKDRVYIGFKNGIKIEYNKNTGEKVKEYIGYNNDKLTIMKGELFYGNEFDNYYEVFEDKKFEWKQQMIYNEKLYFINKEDGERIYYCLLQDFMIVRGNKSDRFSKDYYSLLEGKNPKELCNIALPAKFDDYAFSSEWLYYNSVEGISRINLKNNKFELLGDELKDINDISDVICTPKGVYTKIDDNLYYFLHANPKDLILIIDDITYFNLHKNKIVFSCSKKNGLFIANPDGSDIKCIAPYSAWYIYIIDDWVYFLDDKAFSDRRVNDYYRIRIDGTGLTRLKDGEPLYVVD